MPANETFQLAGPSQAPVNGTSPAVTLIGSGMDLGTEDPTLITSGHDTPAYNLNTSQTEDPRWGTNVIDSSGIVRRPPSVSVPDPLNDGMTELTTSQYAYTFTTTFGTTPSANDQEAQASPGDSGGGVFDQVGGTWYLVGMMDEITNGPLLGNYSSYAYLDEKSEIIDLAYYQLIIEAGMVAVPEPSGLVLAGLGAGIALAAALRAGARRAAIREAALSNDARPPEAALYQPDVKITADPEPIVKRPESRFFAGRLQPGRGVLVVLP